MRGELQAFQSAISDLEAGLSEQYSTAPDLVRDAVLFRYQHALDLSLVVMRTALVECFRERVDSLTVGELLRQARTRGLLPDADQWLTYYASHFESPFLFDHKRSFEQARSFVVRSKSLLVTLATVSRRDQQALFDVLMPENAQTNGA